VILGLFCLGASPPAEVVVWLVSGWAIYLARVGPQVEFDLNGIATGILATACLVWGGHAFLSRIYAARAEKPSDARYWKPVWTLCVITCVVVMFVAGISMLGMGHQIGWMLASDEPIVESDWDAPQRAASRRNLEQLGLALSAYHDANQTFPPGATVDEFGVAYHSWQTHLLPFLERKDLYQRIDFTRPWTDPVNREVFRESLRSFLNPGVEPQDQRDSNGFALSHYGANSRMLALGRGISIDEIADGTSMTIIAGEAAGRFRAWGDPLNFRDPAMGINVSPRGFGSPYAGGAHFLMADGRAQFISERIDAEVLEAMSRPADGRPIAEF
jgi:hypothetical protein